MRSSKSLLLLFLMLNTSILATAQGGPRQLRVAPAVHSLVQRFEDLVAQEKVRLGTLFNYAD